MSDLVQPDASDKAPQLTFYQDALDSNQRVNFSKAASLEGVNEEISLLRVVIKKILDDDPENTKMLIAAVNLLAKLVKIRYTITPEQKQSLREAIQNIIKDVGVPLGVTLLSKKLDGSK